MHVARYLFKIEVLNIEDIYQYMQPEFIEKLKSNVHLQFISEYVGR